VGFDPEVLELLEADWQREQTAPAGDRIDALRDCVEALPEKSKKLLRLRYSDGLSCGEISEQVNAKLDAVYKRLSRLHEALRDCVEQKIETGTEAG
jgi:RNA polymerase sigma-70 factor (ECF subfamily)